MPRHASPHVPALLTLLFAALVFSALIAPPARAADLQVLRDAAMGMDMATVKRMLRRQSGDPGLEILEDIVSLPLGIDFYAGASLYTWDTGITVLQAEGFQPLYFHDDKLFGLKQSAVPQAELKRLKRRFPGGEVFWHKFPRDKHASVVFEGQTEKIYAWTNRHGNLIIYHNPTRKRIIEAVQGSYCWHSKRFSPNLDTFEPHYLQCVRGRSDLGREILEEDLQSCRRYCENTPEVFSSEECTAHCRSAHEQALAVERSPRPAPTAEPEPPMAEAGQPPAGLPQPRPGPEALQVSPQTRTTLKVFVREYLLDSQAADPAKVLRHYADRVDYYDRGMVAHAAILADKRRYYRRWPVRRYALDGRVVVRNTDQPRAKQLVFLYDFTVQHAGERRSIVGKAKAELLVSLDEGVRILREQGEVLHKQVSR
jgi:hypothetical protein